MFRKLSPLAGKPAPESLLVDVKKLVDAYYAYVPDPSIPAQRVAFGTSGHRGSSFDVSFKEERPVDALPIAEAADRLRDREQVPFIERSVER